MLVNDRNCLGIRKCMPQDHLRHRLHVSAADGGHDGLPVPARKLLDSQIPLPCHHPFHRLGHNVQRTSAGLCT
eukprot:6105634-Pleurochrysis_carterae.AAC.2